MPRTVIITGASSGIGAEFARQLAPRTRTLVLVARRSDRLAGLKSELLATHPDLDVQIRKADISDEAQTEALARSLLDSGLPIDMLVNSAGLGDHSKFAEGDWSRVRDMIAVNISGLTRLTWLLLPELKKHEHAAIVNVSSIAGLIPAPGMAVYGATKAYVTSFSEALRAELRGTGISVTAVCPGPVDTEFRDIAERTSGGGLPPSPEFLKVPVRTVVREALTAVSRDRARVIPGLQVAILMTLATILPLFMLRMLLNRRQPTCMPCLHT